MSEAGRCQSVVSIPQSVMMTLKKKKFICSIQVATQAPHQGRKLYKLETTVGR